jgi:phage/plasmid-like protein (TIGR03299 family)
LTTAVDGSLKTTGKFVSTRAICNNTLSIALAEGNKTVVAVSHRSEWDAEQVKVDLGLIDEGWFNFIKQMRKLAETPITGKQAEFFYQDLIFENKKPEPTGAELRKVGKLLDLYHNGMGAELGNGTAWNALNAVTEMFTHGTGRKDPSAQMWDSLVVGAQDNLKTKAMNMALAMV